MRKASATAVLLAFCLAAGGVPAAEGEEKKGAGGKEARKETPPPEPTPREKQILALFGASRKHFRDGRIFLEYDFERRREQAEELVQDWRPSLEQSRQRIRWARGLEGSWSSIEQGIVLGDFGQWIHRAVFTEVEVKTQLLKVSQVRPGSMLGPVFFNEKKKLSLGSNGVQAVCLSGHRPARPPFPRASQNLPASHVRHTIGFKYDGKTVEASLNGRKTADTSGASKFAEGFDTGRPGIAWGPAVQTFLFSITIEGRLDPDWVARELGEDIGKPSSASLGRGQAASRAR